MLFCLSFFIFFDFLCFNLVFYYLCFFFFFFNDTATTEIYTLSLHHALPISCLLAARAWTACGRLTVSPAAKAPAARHRDSSKRGARPPRRSGGPLPRESRSLRLHARQCL